MVWIAGAAHVVAPDGFVEGLLAMTDGSPLTPIASVVIGRPLRLVRRVIQNGVL